MLEIISKLIGNLDNPIFIVITIILLTITTLFGKNVIKLSTISESESTKIVNNILKLIGMLLVFMCTIIVFEIFIDYNIKSSRLKNKPVEETNYESTTANSIDSLHKENINSHKRLPKKENRSTTNIVIEAPKDIYRLRLLKSSKMVDIQKVKINNVETNILEMTRNIVIIEIPKLNFSYSVELILTNSTLKCSTIFVKEDNERKLLECI